ncbi:M28 family peptidase [Streptomyces sp. CA-252508]|uniref:M28 family peptidase n=1 Tax=Streptomyces sp. CA-252508 TaxID=3418946 RepID=UPI003D8FE70B
MAAAECLRRLLDDGGTPTRNIRFVLFNAEEQALTGSKFSARAAEAAGDRIAGVFQMDMIAGRQRASAPSRDPQRLVGRRAGRHRVRRPGRPAGAYRTADRPGGDGPAGHRRRRPGGGAQRPRRLPRAGGGRPSPCPRACSRRPTASPGTAPGSTTHPATPPTTRTTAPTSPPPSHGPSPRPPSRSRACESPRARRRCGPPPARPLGSCRPGRGRQGFPPETLPHGAFRRCGPSETGTRDDRSGVRLRGAARSGGGHPRRRGRPAPP